MNRRWPKIICRCFYIPYTQVVKKKQWIKFCLLREDRWKLHHKLIHPWSFIYVTVGTLCVCTSGKVSSVLQSIKLGDTLNELYFGEVGKRFVSINFHYFSSELLIQGCFEGKKSESFTKKTCTVSHFILKLSLPYWFYTLHRDLIWLSTNITNLHIELENQERMLSQCTEF